MKIYVSSDHAGFAMRAKLVPYLRSRGVDVEDVGPTTDEPVDYPEEAAKVARLVRDDPGAHGLLTCGSGLGMCLAANKVRGVRAALAWNVEAAHLARAHNDANVLCLGERLVPEATARAIVDAWLETPFEGGRHARRVAKIEKIETIEMIESEESSARARARSP